MATNNTIKTTKKVEAKQSPPSSNGEINLSKYKTSPPLQVFGDNANRIRPNTYKQLGRATSYVSNGDSLYVNTGPHPYAIAAWDYARRNEPIISDGLDKMVLAILAKIGSYNHPNPDIKKFIKANLKNKVRSWIENIAYTMLWAGKSVSEIVLEKKYDGDVGQLWVKDLINYHPSQVILRLNNYGALTHGEQVLTSQFNTGVWVPRPILTKDFKAYNIDRNCTGSHIRLPKDKVVIVSYKDEGNNPHGTPALYSAIQWSLYKAAFVDMYSIALDRYGTPLMYFVVPATQTTEDIEEIDGTIRKKMFREALQDELQDLRSGSVLILERQGNKDAPEPKVEALTTGNNFGDSFVNAIELCDKQMLHSLGIPNLIIRDGNSGLGTGTSAEKQLEIFDMAITQIATKVSQALIEQLIKTLIVYNFYGVPDADNYGEFIIKPMRYADYKIVADSASILATAGYVSPLTNAKDKAFFRSQLGIPNDDEDE